MPLWAPRTRRTKGDLGAGWRKLTVSQGVSSPTARQAPRRSPRAAATREALPTASPASTTSATQSSDAALRGRSWQTLALLLPDCRECVPDPVVGFTPNHEATCSRSVLPVLGGGVVGLGRVPTGPGVAFLSALGKPGHFSVADVIRRPLGTLARGRLDTPPSRTRRDEIDATRTAIRAA